MTAAAFVAGVAIGVLGLRAFDNARAWWNRTSWLP
jgi:hypothetical protein